MKIDNLDEIIKSATDDNRYGRGKELVRRNRIKNLNFKVNSGIVNIEGTVVSKDRYDSYEVKFGFNSRSGRITTMACNCIDFFNSRFSSSNKICKHIVMTL